MTGPEARVVQVNGHSARVWEMGHGPKIGYLGGLVGVPRWTPFLDALAEHYRVVVPALPGFPGSRDYEHLDSVHDWTTATLDLIEAAGLSGADFAASSVGAMLALEVAAVSPASLGRLGLMAPLGLHLDAMPIPHIWARRSVDMAALMCSNTDALASLQRAPEDEDAVEWNLMVSRANAASARLLWPMCELGLAKRLHRVRQPVLLLWGTHDCITPPGYAEEFASRMPGPVEITKVRGAGHLLDIDAPNPVANQIHSYMQNKRNRTE